MPRKLMCLASAVALLSACGSGSKNTLAKPAATVGSNAAANNSSVSNTPSVSDPTPSNPVGTAGSTPAPTGPSAATPTAAPAAAAAPGPLPTPPANAQVHDQVQNTLDGWTSCSVCAAGTHDTTNYWMAPFQTQPSRTGSSRQLFIGGPSWTNALFIKTMPGTNAATHYLWDFWIYLDAASAPNAWTAEMDLWQTNGGREFMIGSQCNFGDGWWDLWDSKNNQWIHSSVPCPRWGANSWHHVQWYVERLPQSQQYRYDTLVFDGTAHPINATYTTNPTTWPDAVGVQWQLDQSANGAPLHEWIDDVRLTMW